MLCVYLVVYWIYLYHILSIFIIYTTSHPKWLPCAGACSSLATQADLFGGRVWVDLLGYGLESKIVEIGLKWSKMYFTARCVKYILQHLKPISFFQLSNWQSLRYFPPWVYSPHGLQGIVFFLIYIHIYIYIYRETEREQCIYIYIGACFHLCFGLYQLVNK